MELYFRPKTIFYELLLTKYKLLSFNISDINIYIMKLLRRLQLTPTEYHPTLYDKCLHCGSNYGLPCCVCGSHICPVTHCQTMTVINNLCSEHQKCYRCNQHAQTTVKFDSVTTSWSKPSCMFCYFFQ